MTARRALRRVGEAAIAARMTEAQIRADPATAMLIAQDAMRATLDLSKPGIGPDAESIAVAIAREKHGSFEAHPTLYAACYEGALAAAVLLRITRPESTTDVTGGG